MILTGVPRATVSARQARRRARTLLAGVAVGPLLGLVALAVAAGGTGRAAPATSVGHDRAFAQIAAQDYLAGRASVLPYAQGLDPTFGRDQAANGAPASAIAYRSLSWRSASEHTADARSYEIDTFVVATTTGLWHLDVEVIDSPSGPVIGADPALSPVPLAASNVAAALTYGSPGQAGSSTLSPGALGQVQAWAQAYADGDGATLYRLTGDTRSVTYPALRGWVFDQVSVDASVVKGDAALAQVQVAMHQADHPAASVTSSYDLLLGRLNQSLPFVQAWGVAGSGPTLVPYANALGAPSGGSQP